MAFQEENIENIAHTEHSETVTKAEELLNEGFVSPEKIEEVTGAALEQVSNSIEARGRLAANIARQEAEAKLKLDALKGSSEEAIRRTTGLTEAKTRALDAIARRRAGQGRIMPS